jgi:hypothetical protein
MSNSHALIGMYVIVKLEFSNKNIKPIILRCEQSFLIYAIQMAYSVNQGLRKIS